MNNFTRVYINGRFMTKKTTGEQRYAFEMLRHLDSLLAEADCDGVQLELLVPGRILSQYNYSFKKVHINKKFFLRGHLWEQLELPLYVKDNLLINFCDMAPVCKKNQIVVIHDMILKSYPQNYSNLFRWWHLIVFYLLAKRTKQFITVSEFSRKEISHYLGIGWQRIKILSPSASDSGFLIGDTAYLPPRASQIRTKLPERYILALGSLSGHKNFVRLAAAMEYLAAANIHLVVAGMTNGGIFATSDIQVTSHITYLGYVDDDELSYLYENALCFVLPSIYEGFGIPPLEAMACGCPVVLSDIEVFHEVCGQAAVYFDPLSSKDIAEKITLVVQNQDIRKKLITAGCRQVKKYSWEKSAKELLNLIRGMVEH